MELQTRCTECEAAVLPSDGGWSFWTDGIDLFPYCSRCSLNEFGWVARSGGEDSESTESNAA
jgi:hypothetical protein